MGATWWTTSHLVIVAGKGGVGKTTVAAALGRAARDTGLGVTVVGIADDAACRLLDVEPSTVEDVMATPATRGQLRTTVIDPEEALAAHLDDSDLGALGRRMSRTGLLELVAAATPGIRELLVLGRLRQLEQANTSDLVVVDAPASGHATGLLRAPRALAALAARGRIRDQADLATEFLTDELRTQVVLVTLPEDTPVNETIETAFALEDDPGIAVGPVLVNRCAPPSPPCRPPTAELVPTLDPAVARLVDDALGEDHTRYLAERRSATRLGEESGLPCIELPDASTPSGGVDIERIVDALARTR
jgi:arsenite-transporting ATPase